jgi:hypothetical protein
MKMKAKSQAAQSESHRPGGFGTGRVMAKGNVFQVDV